MCKILLADSSVQQHTFPTNMSASEASAEWLREALTLVPRDSVAGRGLAEQIGLACEIEQHHQQPTRPQPSKKDVSLTPNTGKLQNQRPTTTGPSSHVSIPQRQARL